MTDNTPVSDETTAHSRAPRWVAIAASAAGIVLAGTAAVWAASGSSPDSTPHATIEAQVTPTATPNSSPSPEPSVSASPSTSPSAASPSVSASPESSTTTAEPPKKPGSSSSGSSKSGASGTSDSGSGKSSTKSSDSKSGSTKTEPKGSTKETPEPPKTDTSTKSTKWKWGECVKSESDAQYGQGTQGQIWTNGVDKGEPTGSNRSCIKAAWMKSALSKYVTGTTNCQYYGDSAGGDHAQEIVSRAKDWMARLKADIGDDIKFNFEVTQLSNGYQVNVKFLGCS